MGRPRVRKEDAALVNPDQPPDNVLRRARARARELGHSVFLFRDDSGWRIEADIGSVPMDGRTQEIPAGPPGGETDNKGGC
jgi:hypothetical protein